MIIMLLIFGQDNESLGTLREIYVGTKLISVPWSV